MTENKPENEHQGEQVEGQVHDEDPMNDVQDYLLELIKEGSEEDFRRAEALMNVLSHVHAMRKLGYEAESAANKAEIQAKDRQIQLEKLRAEFARIEADREESAMTEELKLRFEAYRNITVLDSGALIAFAVVTQNLFASPIHQGWLYAAYACLLLSLVNTMLMMFILTYRVPGVGAPKPEEEGRILRLIRRVVQLIMGLANLLSFGGFVAGVGAFIVFLSQNF